MKIKQVVIGGGERPDIIALTDTGRMFILKFSFVNQPKFVEIKLPPDPRPFLAPRKV